MSFYSLIQKFHPSKSKKAAPIDRWIFIPFDQISFYNQLIFPYLSKSEQSNLDLDDKVFTLFTQQQDSNSKATAKDKERERESICFLFVETSAKPNRRPYHKQKLVLLLSAMRHFAKQLGEMGFQILYQFSELDYAACLLEIKNEFAIHEIHCLEIQEPEVAQPFEACKWMKFQPNNLYLCSRDEFREIFPKGSKYLHETFYRKMRIKFQLLLEDSKQEKKGKTISYKPLGGKWNLDHENRSNWKKTDPIPLAQAWVKLDEISQEVAELISRRYPKSFGSLENFQWPVDRKETLHWLGHFARNLLIHFGKYEDAMSIEEPYLFHSLLSPLIHLGLLHPYEVVQFCVKEYELRYNTSEEIPLASLEGFVRQIIGWREYMRHIFLENVMKYKKANTLKHKNPLPGLYWGKNSGLKCLDSTVELVIKRGYSHHITRLMVLSNFANLMLVDPHELNEWFWIAYIDAFEWVVTPNVVGMGTYADGGICATKPYISSANYIKKMGPEYCKSCKYKATGLLEEDACPFNALYWDFIGRNLELYKKQGRVDFAVSRWNSFDKEKKQQISLKANQIRSEFQ